MKKEYNAHERSPVSIRNASCEDYICDRYQRRARLRNDLVNVLFLSTEFIQKETHSLGGRESEPFGSASFERPKRSRLETMHKKWSVKANEAYFELTGVAGYK